MPPSLIEKDVHNTLAYFAYNQYPLTAFEVYKWQYCPERVYSYQEIDKVLKGSDWLLNRVGHFEGMYGLGNNLEVEQQVAARKRRFLDAVKKQKKACKVVQYISRLPSVRGVAICNSLAYHFTREKSDIDLFIISRRGTIWLARFFSTLIVKLLGMRPKEDNKKDTFCLSFFVDERYLDIENSMMNSNDIYYPYWVSNLIPVYNPDNLYEKFLEANKWHKKYLPNTYPNQFSKEIKANNFSKFFGILANFIFNPPIIKRWLYNWYRSFQIKIIDKNLKALINIDTRVIVNERMLKFYSNDNRELFARRWKERVRKILNKYKQ